ncbi:MAG: site-specific integrase [Bacteroidales bacterium]|nr:site-specific integrase [Bacteroidales bacterium]
MLEIKKYIDFKTNVNCLSEHTLLQYKQVLSDLEKVNFDYVKFAKQIEGCQRNSKRVYLTIVKNFYKFNKDSREKMVELPRKESKVNPYITYDEYLLLRNVFFHKAPTKFNLLKTLIIRLSFETGVRSFELLNIPLENVKENCILINGKGNKQRNVYLSDDLRAFIDKYREVWGPQKNLIEISYQALSSILKRMGAKYLNGKHLSSHMFRRGYATHFMSKFNNISALSRSMGHSNISTTMSYVCAVDYSHEMANIVE